LFLVGNNAKDYFLKTFRPSFFIPGSFYKKEKLHYTSFERLTSCRPVFIIQSMTSSLAIFLHDSRYDRLYQAVNLLLTASSMGWSSHLFLFFDALAAFMADEWDEVNITEPASGSVSNLDQPAPGRKDSDWRPRLQRNIELANFLSLYELLTKAKGESGDLTICACSTSVRLLELDPKAVKKRVDEIVGLPSMLQISARASQVLYI
jgi:peroxiredoxin family protein